jgi:hypothetical protein
MQVFAEGSNHSRLVWITDLLPNEAAATIGKLVEMGAGAIKQTLEAQAMHD